MKQNILIIIFILLSSFLYATIINVPTPYATIQAGITTAANGDTVLVQPGTYVENINYSGKLITVASLFYTTADTSYISTTIIDGGGTGAVVIFNNDETSSAVLSGFTLTNGGNNAAGSGIFCNQTSPTLQNLIVTGNNCTQFGGGICCDDHSSPLLQNITISDNTSGSLGGGIYCNNYSSPLLQNVIISGNTASLGGGIYCFNSTPILRNVTVSDNIANEGGGIYLDSSNLSIENATISGNSATYGDGGGIFCNDADPTIMNSAITSNTADYDGGGIYCGPSSNLILQNVTISGNSATWAGGGITCENSNLDMVNSILWWNTPVDVYNDGSSITVTYSDINGGWTGTGNIDADPLFADPGSGDYHLTWANFPIPDATMSPCIDAGDPSSLFDPDGTIADMGAFYFDKSPGAPEITAVEDVPDDQGRYVQAIWNRSPYDAPNSPVTIELYSVWRFDHIFGDRGFYEIYDDPREIFEKAARDNDKNYYWQRDDEILTFITELPAMGFAQYSVIAPTLIDSSIVSINYSAFKVFAHTDVTLIYYPSLPDSGYSVDNIAPDETDVTIAQNGTDIGLTWDEVEYGTHQGNSYPEINGIWYKIYAGDSPNFVCDEAHLIDTITNLNYDYPLAGEEKKFFKIVVSDQPAAGRFINNFSTTSESVGDYQKVK